MRKLKEEKDESSNSPDLFKDASTCNTQSKFANFKELKEIQRSNARLKCFIGVLCVILLVLCSFIVYLSHNFELTNSIHGRTSRSLRETEDNDVYIFLNKDAVENEKRRSEKPSREKNSKDDHSDGSIEENKSKGVNIRKNKKPLSEVEREYYHTLVADQLKSSNIESNLRYLSETSHIAGTKEGTRQAKWLAGKLKSYKFDRVDIKTYRCLLSYPKRPGKITLLDDMNDEQSVITVIEKKLDSFEKNAKYEVPPPFLAYTTNSTVEGELVYANFGTEDDFEHLRNLKVDLKGKIVLIRYGVLSRNKKIKFAERERVKGIIIFSDPETYSPTGVYYPNSWFLPPDGVQRGTLLRLRGDPLTRGYPAIEGLYRRKVEDVPYFPKVPVQPIGYGDAEKLLSILDGKSAPSSKWSGNINTTYRITSKDHRKVKLNVNVTKEMRHIKNVIGVIKGEVEPDRLVVIGNHRDAWTYGAGDPSSGTAVMVEVARALGWLKERGWRPRRTILICSWDAEEFGLMGSTEWTEENAKILSHQAVAYINVDTAVQGNHTIQLKSTPEMVDVFFDAARKFEDPDSHRNFYDEWVKKNKKDSEDRRKEPTVKIFKEGSDYMPFYGDLGVPCMDFRYMFSTSDMGIYNYPVYHTMHDNFAWLKKFVDPDFRYHITVAKIWTQVILLLADTTLLPFNFVRYSQSLIRRVEGLVKYLKKSKIDFDLSLLEKTVTKLHNATLDFHHRLKELDQTDALAVRAANDQMMMFERTFVTSEDIPGEATTRHVYHTAGLKKAFTVYAAAQRKNSSSKNKALETLELKYSVYTYHLMMAIHALRSPFTGGATSEED